MAALESNDDLVFEARTLRLVIGALAFAFPSMVIALTGFVTNSISASYYEPQTRDVFVGFLFIIGALLIAYKGHLQGEGWSKEKDVIAWILSFRWLKIYQEDLISTVGGLAAIFTALFPTACKGCEMNTDAFIHVSGAFLMFGSVVYFCMVAFLRSLNRKIVESEAYTKDQDVVRQIIAIKAAPTSRWQNLGYRLLAVLCTPFPAAGEFVRIAERVSRNYDTMKQNGVSLPSKAKYLWGAYEKKLSRGYVYVWCGLIIVVTLATFLVLLFGFPKLVNDSTITFVVETIALVFFGIAWMTASKLEYLVQFGRWLDSRKKVPAVTQRNMA